MKYSSRLFGLKFCLQQIKGGLYYFPFHRHRSSSIDARIISLTCHPMPLLKTYAGGGVALANRAAAWNAPVVCNPQTLLTKSDRQISLILTSWQITIRHDRENTFKKIATCGFSVSYLD